MTEKEFYERWSGETIINIVTDREYWTLTHILWRTHMKMVESDSMKNAYLIFRNEEVKSGKPFAFTLRELVEAFLQSPFYQRKNNEDEENLRQYMSMWVNPKDVVMTRGGEILYPYKENIYRNKERNKSYIIEGSSIDYIVIYQEGSLPLIEKPEGNNWVTEVKMIEWKGREYFRIEGTDLYTDKEKKQILKIKDNVITKIWEEKK